MIQCGLSFCEELGRVSLRESTEWLAMFTYFRAVVTLLRGNR